MGLRGALKVFISEGPPRLWLKVFGCDVNDVFLD